MIVVSDSDILSIFGKVGSVSYLKRLFGEIYIPPAVYEELRRAKEIGFDFVDDLIDNITILNLSGDEYRSLSGLSKMSDTCTAGNCRGSCYTGTETVCF